VARPMISASCIVAHTVLRSLDWKKPKTFSTGSVVSLDLHIFQAL
jgi:hypothetical protein